jgi:outer membrane protein, multidrug efflux system
MSRWSVFLFAAVGACATAPSYRAPEVQLPSTFREKLDTVPRRAAVRPAVEPVLAVDTAIARDPFWLQLRDSTLIRLLQEAVRGNLDVRTAAARVSGARASRTEAVLDFAPTVTAEGGYTRQRLSGAGFPFGSGVFPDQDVWDAGFVASWELDIFGRVRRNVQAQGAFLAVTQEDLRDVQVALTSELAGSYFELRGIQEQLSVARRNAENQRRTLQVTRDRLEAGRGTAFDVERAQAQLSFTLATIPVLESREADAQYRIGVLVGRVPAAVAQELERVAALPPLPEAITVESPDSIIRRRPDVAAAERRLAVERALVGVAKADYLPRLSLGGSLGYSASAFDSLGDRGTFRYAVGPVVTWPALNLGRVKARVDASRAREEEARAQYTQTVLLALQDIESALARYRTARDRVDQVQAAAAASERAADLARLRFTGGVADFLQVLDAERTQLEAQDQLALARTESATAYAALYQALGGSRMTEN